MDQKGSEDSLAYEYTQSTTLHGIARVTDKEKSLVKRCAWAIFFLACFALFLYFLCHAFIKYYAYPVTTKVTYTTQAKLDFPSVTICNYNYITAAYLEKKNDRLLNASVDALSLTLNPFAESPGLSEELTNYMKTVDAEEFYSQGAHQMDEVYSGCSYNDGSSVKCQLPDGLMVTRGTDMGVCHTFHPQSYIDATGKPLGSMNAGQSDGFTVMIDIQQDQYTLCASSAGVKVLVHDPKIVPPIGDLGIALHPGTEVSMAVKKTIMISLPEPYAKKGDSCLDTEDPDFVNPLKYHDYYSYEACEQEHLIAAMLNACNCVDYFNKVPGVQICNLYDSFVCVEEAKAEYYSYETSHMCLKRCQEVLYDVTLSQSKFPNKRVLWDVMKFQNVDEEYFKDSIINLHVYFGELAVQTVKQEKGYTLQSAIAEIGGYLGLCLGASLLTLCELLQLFWDYCERCANRDSKNKRIVDLEMGQNSASTMHT